MRDGCSIMLSTPPEPFRELEELGARDELERIRFAVGQERDHPAEVCSSEHVRPRGSGGSPGLAHRAPVRPPPRDRRRKAATRRAFSGKPLAHPHGKPRDPAQNKRCRNGPGTAPKRFLQEVEPLRQRVINEAADCVAATPRIRSSANGMMASAPRDSGPRWRYRRCDSNSTTSVAPTACDAGCGPSGCRRRRRSTADSTESRPTPCPRRRRGTLREVVVELGRRHVREAVALRVYCEVMRYTPPYTSAISTTPLAWICEVHQCRRRSDPRAERDARFASSRLAERFLPSALRVGFATREVVVALLPPDGFLDVRRRLVGCACRPILWPDSRPPVRRGSRGSRSPSEEPRVSTRSSPRDAGQPRGGTLGWPRRRRRAHAVPV